MSFLSAIPIIGDIIKGAENIISEVVEDKDKKNQLLAEFKKMSLDAEQKLLEMEHKEKMAQIDINKQAAASSDKYVRRARPTTLWIANIGLAYVFLLHPLGCWALKIWAPEITPPPMIDAEYLLILLGGLLGFGGYRTYEKMKGVSGR
jgi:hypothetical protein